MASGFDESPQQADQRCEGEAVNGLRKADPDRRSAYDILVSNYDIVEKTIRSVARRQRLRPDEADDLGSLLRLKLVDNDCAVLRRFERRSTLATYLLTVATRVCLDRRTAERGKWRPSAAARRLGRTAVLMERLVVRDGLAFAEAQETLRINHRVSESPHELEVIRVALPDRVRLKMIADDRLLASIPAPDTGPQSPGGATGELPRAVRVALARALSRLARPDRRLIWLRYRRGWTVARIARELDADQMRLYRHLARIHGMLRRTLMEGSAVPGVGALQP